MVPEWEQTNPWSRAREKGTRKREATMDLNAEMEMESQQAKDKLKFVAEELGHEIRVFSGATYASIPSKVPSAAEVEEDDDFYELQPADYFQLISNRISEEAKMLKTRKMREAELAAQRAKITKAVMRVRFPDGYVLEADFRPSETVQSLVVLLKKVIARPDLPFYLYTVPPKKRIPDMTQDFYTVGFVPGANVYFSYDLPEDPGLNTDVKSGPYICEEIRSLEGLSLISKPSNIDDSKIDSSSAPQSVASQSDPSPPANKKPARPKWFKR